MIPQGRQRQEATLVAAEKSHGCCCDARNISLGSICSLQTSTHRGGWGKKPPPTGAQLIQGGRGAAFQWKQTTELPRTPIMSMHSPGGICRKTGTTQMERHRAGNILWMWHLAKKAQGRGFKKPSFSFPTSRQWWVPLCFFFASLPNA